MNTTLRNLAVAAALSLIATGAAAQGLSTSASSPTPVPETGVVTGTFPSGTEEATYYLSLDLKPGDLATQISIQGRPGRDKALAVPGSFAAGDVRHRSIKRVATAAGEGAMAIAFVHRYLEETA